MPKSKGFTLVELLVVITIIAILATVGFAAFSSTQKGARDATRKGDINAIANALEQTYSNGLYSELLPSYFSDGTVPQDPRDPPGVSTSGPFPPNPFPVLCGASNNLKCEYCERPGGLGMGNCTGATDQGGEYPIRIAAPGHWGSEEPSKTFSSFLICTNLETPSGNGGAYYYCIKSRQ